MFAGTLVEKTKKIQAYNIKHGEISPEEKSAGILSMLYYKRYLLRKNGMYYFTWISDLTQNVFVWCICLADIGTIIMMKYEMNVYFHIVNVKAIETSPLYFANAALCLVSTYNK